MEAPPSSLSNSLITAINNKDYRSIDVVVDYLPARDRDEVFYYVVNNGDITTLQNTHIILYVNQEERINGIKLAMENDDINMVKYLFWILDPKLSDYISSAHSKDILDFLDFKFYSGAKGNERTDYNEVLYLSAYYGNIDAYNYFKAKGEQPRLSTLLGAIKGIREEINGDQLKIIDDILSEGIDLSKLPLQLSVLYPEIYKLKVDISDYFDLLRKVYFTRELRNNVEVRNEQIPFLSTTLKSMFPLLDIHKVLIDKDISTKEEMYDYLNKLAEEYIAENLPKSKEYKAAKLRMPGLEEVLILRITDADSNGFIALLGKVEKYYDFGDIRMLGLEEAKEVVKSVIPNLTSIEIRNILD